MIPRKVDTSLNNINPLVFVMESLCVFGKIRVNCLGTVYMNLML